MEQPAKTRSDRFGFYANNSGYSTYLAGKERMEYVAKSRKFDTYDKSHGLVHPTVKREEIDTSNPRSKGDVESVPVVAPVLNEVHIDNGVQTNEARKTIAASSVKPISLNPRQPANTVPATGY